MHTDEFVYYAVSFYVIVTSHNFALMITDDSNLAGLLWAFFAIFLVIIWTLMWSNLKSWIEDTYIPRSLFAKNYYVYNEETGEYELEDPDL